jgi:hypothetical protein
MAKTISAYSTVDAPLSFRVSRARHRDVLVRNLRICVP